MTIGKKILVVSHRSHDARATRARDAERANAPCAWRLRKHPPDAWRRPTSCTPPSCVRRRRRSTPLYSDARAASRATRGDGRRARARRDVTMSMCRHVARVSSARRARRDAASRATRARERTRVDTTVRFYSRASSSRSLAGGDDTARARVSKTHSGGKRAHRGVKWRTRAGGTRANE